MTEFWNIVIVFYSISTITPALVTTFIPVIFSFYQ